MSSDLYDFTVPLKDIVIFINGDRSANYPKPEDYIDNGLPFISAADLLDGKVQYDKVKRITSDAFNRLRSGKIQDKDVLFCLRGTIGKIARIGMGEAGAIASSLVIIRPSNLVNSDYLYYWLGSSVAQRIALSLNNGSAQPNLSVGQLQMVQVPLPNLKYQNDIAFLLKSLDDRIILLRETNATLEAIAQALFKSWFVDFDPVHANAARARGEAATASADHQLPPDIAALFPDSFEDSELGPIPKGWRMGAFSEVCTIASGKRPDDRSDKVSAQFPIPLYGGAGIMGYTSASLFDRKMILTGRVGTLGKVHIAHPPFWASDNVLVISEKEGSSFSHVLNWLKSIDVHALNRGSTQPLLTQKDLGKQLGVIPPRELLFLFESYVGGIYKKIQSNNTNAETLTQLRDTLLPRLISGQLRLPEAQEFLAEAGV